MVNKSVTFLLLALVGLFVFSGAAQSDGWTGYVETKFSASYAAGTYLSADSDSVIVMLVRDCEFVSLGIAVGTETALESLQVLYGSSFDSVTWKTVATTSTITAGNDVTLITFRPVDVVSTDNNYSKWLKVTLRDVGEGSFATVKLSVYRGCYSDPHQVANW
jgi:hypothetical protein